MLTPDQEWAIVYGVLSGKSFRRVATEQKCHVSTVKTVFKYYEENGTITGRIHMHREGSLSTIIEVLRRQSPWLYLDECVRYAKTAGGVNLDFSLLYNTIYNTPVT